MFNRNLLLILLTCISIKPTFADNLADSTSITPPNNVQIFYPTDKTYQPVHLTTLETNALPDCPFSYSMTDCPDVNSPNTNSKTCPLYCKVSRSPLANDPSMPLDPSTNITNPSCPQGYAEVEPISSGPEYAWYPDGTHFTPKNMDQFWSYTNNGKHMDYCSQKGSFQYFFDTCNSSVLHQKLYVDSGRKPTELYYTDQLIPGKGVVLVNGNKVLCWKSSSCSQITQEGNPRFVSEPKDCNFKNNNDDNPYGYSFQYIFSYYEDVECNVPAGNYLTGRSVPTSIACARLQPHWEQLNSNQNP